MRDEADMNLKRRFFLKLFALTGAALLLGRGMTAHGAVPIERDPPKTVAELYDMMCSALPLGQSTCLQYSVTGEEYVEYHTGVNPAGFIFNGEQKNPEEVACRWAWQTFLKQMMAHDADPKNDPRKLTLYWRVKPEFAYYDEDLNFDVGGVPRLEKRARIYLRYLVSSKPAIYTEQELLERRLST